MFDEEILYDRMIVGHRTGKGRGKGSQTRLWSGLLGHDCYLNQKGPGRQEGPDVAHSHGLTYRRAFEGMPGLVFFLM